MEYIMEQQELFFSAVAVFIAILSGTAAGIWLYMRKKYISYTEKVLSSIDDLFIQSYFSSSVRISLMLKFN